MLNEKSLTGHAVVLGAGVMGAGIAALLANVGWTVDLLDRVEGPPSPPILGGAGSPPAPNIGGASMAQGGRGRNAAAEGNSSSTPDAAPPTKTPPRIGGSGGPTPPRIGGSGGPTPPRIGGSGEANRNRLAQEGLERALKARPPHFALPEYVGRVRVGNTEDDLERVCDADWVVEAVAEDMATKRALLARVAALVGPETVVSSNTSGLNLLDMTADCPNRDEFRQRFLGAHFFNPPRYMKPVEVIATAVTDPAVAHGFTRFADRVLGKRVILAKPTPGFISTRLGMYALARTLQLAAARGLTVEQADYLTGPLLGRPRTGTFRLADVVGLDVTAKIIADLATALPEDFAYHDLLLPEAMHRLIAEGRVGAKAGAGFYKRAPGGEIFSLDLNTLEYRPRIEPTPYPAEVEALPLAERLRRVWELSPEQDGGFLRAVLTDTLGYIADVTPEVADRIVEVDDALIGGFGWEMGPYHILDALGPEAREAVPALTADRGVGAGLAPPSRTAVRDRFAPAVSPAAGRAGQAPPLQPKGTQPLRYYTNEAGKHFYFDIHTGQMEPLPRPPDVIVLKDLKKAGKTVYERDNTTLVDLGGGVACLEWRTKMGTLDPEVVEALEVTCEMAAEGIAALILVGADGPFSAGFDLNVFAAAIEKQDWAYIEGILKQLQQTLHAIKYASVPVMAATRGYALGGGCEITLHCAAVQAAFESSIGLPEANVGLIPAGGGVTQMLLRAMAPVHAGNVLERPDPYPFIEPVWTAMRLARYSSSADEARALGYLRDRDGVTRHPDRLLHDAKERALALAAAYAPPEPVRVRVMGADGLARFRWQLHLLRRADRITAHDARIADALARVMCGGDLRHAAEVTEDYLLELEREAFLSLCGTPETIARIRHLLATGKPLRN